MAIRAKRAFTIIEVLVVLAIILAMVGILLVSLGPVRANARRTECAAKLRGIYGLTQNYLVDSGGKIPYGTWSAMTSKQRSWDDLLLKYVVPDVTDTVLDDTVSADDFKETEAVLTVFLCPDDESSQARTYTMPRTRQSNVDLGIAISASGASPPKQYRMSQIEQPAAVMLLTERVNGGRNILGNLGMATIDNPNEHYGSDRDKRLHPEELNYLLLDGHIESLLPKDTIGKGTLAAPQGMWTRASGD